MVSEKSSPERKDNIADPEKSEFERIEDARPQFQVSEQLEKRLNRKFDLHMVPWLFALWLLAYIDRSNIGNARIDGLAEELGLNGDKFNNSLAVFYVPYLLYDVPSNWVLKKLKAGYYLPGLVVAWGIVSTCIGFVKSYAGLLVARFFLGLTEAGLLGGMVVYLAMFYQRHSLLLRIGIFYSAAPLAGAVGGLLATGLAQIKTSKYQGWSFIFFIEGAITVLVGTTAVLFLPHTPKQAKFLTEEEREYALARMLADSQGTSKQSDVEEEKFDWYYVKRAIFCWQTMLLSWLYFAIITPIYSFSLFLPTILRTLKYTTVQTQLLTVPPNMGGFFMVLLVCWLSDKTKVRGYYMLAGELLAIVGYIMLISTSHGLVQYGGTFLVAAGIFPCSPLILGWLSNNLAPHYVRATGTGFQITIANCAAFIATFTYISTDAPRYITGHAINLGMLGLALILTTATIFWVRIENRKRDNGERDHRLEKYHDREEKLGDRHPQFRYTI